MKLLFVSAVSACIEIGSSEPFYVSESFDVALNGEVILKNVRKNVFSLFNLQPDCKYVVSAKGNDIKFATPKVDATLRVKDFGAKADGKTDDTFAIKEAIARCKKNSLLVFEEGEYLIGPIDLKSDVVYELKKGAKLIGCADRKKYPVIKGYEVDDRGNEYIGAVFEGVARDCYKSLISGYKCRNALIVGEGEINGNAENCDWWKIKESEGVARPRIVFWNECNKNTIHGITFKNSPSWNIHPFFCKNVGFFDLKIYAPKDSPNTDGLNPEACDGVVICGCEFSVGDDCIAIKSGKKDLADKYRKSAQNYTIRNCLMQYGHGAIVIGSEVSGGVKNLSVSKCAFNKTDRGVRIKVRRGRGKLCVIDNLEFCDIKMTGVLTPFVINMFYYCDADGKSEYVQSKCKIPVDDRTPYIGAISYKNIECADSEYAAGYFDGLPEQPIREIKMENISFSFKMDAGEGCPAMLSNVKKYSRAGIYIDNVVKFVWKNVTFKNTEGTYFLINNCDEVIRL